MLVKAICNKLCKDKDRRCQGRRFDCQLDHQACCFECFYVDKDTENCIELRKNGFVEDYFKYLILRKKLSSEGYIFDGERNGV